METLQQHLHQALASFSWWEAAAVLLGVAYLLLAVRENIWCWTAAFLSTSIFVFLFWDVSLLMESGLQVYYLIMAVYGWRQWQQGSGEKGELQIQRWSWRQHLLAAGLVLLLASASGLLLRQNTGAVMPFLDSFTSWGAVLSTWMVARKILENWLYWLLIDSLSIYLYLDRSLYLTALLFLFYLIIAFFGYRQWLRHYQKQHS
ncbi:MAG: nicotinamide riboside transporter PnuC [Gammaproteobacteria bacterium]|nr:nicotinamide riboside transporter PnuC [Gammaproteobacteria bacterium]